MSSENPNNPENHQESDPVRKEMTGGDLDWMRTFLTNNWERLNPDEAPALSEEIHRAHQKLAGMSKKLESSGSQQ